MPCHQVWKIIEQLTKPGAIHVLTRSGIDDMQPDVPVWSSLRNILDVKFLGGLTKDASESGVVLYMDLADDVHPRDPIPATTGKLMFLSD